MISGKIATSLRVASLLIALALFGACKGPGAIGRRSTSSATRPSLQTGSHIPRETNVTASRTTAPKKQKSRKKKKKEKAPERKVDTDYNPRGGFR